MRVLFLTGREISYERNAVLLRAFRRLGQVVVCAENTSASIPVRSLRVGLGALRYLRTREFDLVFVGFYGHLLMLPVGFLSKQPVLFDAFVSTYDTLCNDRKVFAPRSLPGRLAFWLDRAACHLASKVMVDTSLQADYFAKTFGLDASQVHPVPVGCSAEVFARRLSRPRDAITRVLYYCSYQPLHGVDTVIRAAAQLTVEPIQFKLIGTGPTYVKARQVADELRLENIAFSPFQRLEQLPIEIADANICLGGPFGLSDKANRVIPGKIYQILAMARPLIAANTPANRTLLTHGETALLCTPGSSETLAAAILELHRDPALAGELANAGHRLYTERCSEAAITDRLREIISEMSR